MVSLIAFHPLGHLAVPPRGCGGAICLGPKIARAIERMMTVFGIRRETVRKFRDDENSVVVSTI
jgi:hypothetical protein